MSLQQFQQNCVSDADHMELVYDLLKIDTGLLK